MHSTTLSPPYSCPNYHRPPPEGIGQEEQWKPEGGTCLPLQGLNPASQGQLRRSSEPHPHPRGGSQAPRNQPAQGLPTSSSRPFHPGSPQCQAPSQAGREREPTSGWGATAVARLLSSGAPLRPRHARPASSTLAPPLSPPGLQTTVAFPPPSTDWQDLDT